jgi:hypothetical protein
MVEMTSDTVMPDPAGGHHRGACKVCNGVTFHVLVSPPEAGELARMALALSCCHCGAQITLQESDSEPDERAM